MTDNSSELNGEDDEWSEVQKLQKRYVLRLCFSCNHNEKYCEMLCLKSVMIYYMVLQLYLLKLSCSTPVCLLHGGIFFSYASNGSAEFFSRPLWING